MLKHYVEFYFPGSFVSETAVHEVADRDGPVTLPKGAYGYRFFSREEVEIDGERLVGKCKDFSQMTYYGDILTTADVERMPGNNHILLSNMRINKVDQVVFTVRGNFFPLHEGDVVLPHEALTTY